MKLLNPTPLADLPPIELDFDPAGLPSRAAKVHATLTSFPGIEFTGDQIAELIGDGGAGKSVGQIIADGMRGKTNAFDYSHVHRVKNGRHTSFWFDPDLERTTMTALRVTKKSAKTKQSPQRAPKAPPAVVAAVVIYDAEDGVVVRLADGRMLEGHWLRRK